MVDLDRVRDKLAALTSYRDMLRALDPDAGSGVDRYSRRYLVQAGTQVCIDLANHLIASEGWRTATDFRDAFVRLAEHDVIDRDLAVRLQAMVGMREQLVLRYDVVDDALVARFVADDFGDWDAFARTISRMATGDS